MGANPFETRTYYKQNDCGQHDLSNFIKRSKWTECGIQLGDIGLADSWSGWETFKKVKMGSDGAFALKTFHGTYVKVNENGSLTQESRCQEWETFRQEGGGEKTAFRTVHGGKYLSAHENGSFFLSDKWAGAWETFNSRQL